MDIAEAKEFLKNNHRGCLVTRKKDGSLQMTLVSPVLGADGNVIITARDTTYKVKNIGRNPQISLLVYGEKFNARIIFRSTVRPRSFRTRRPWGSCSIGTGKFAVSRRVGTRSARRPSLKGVSKSASRLKK